MPAHLAYNVFASNKKFAYAHSVNADLCMWADQKFANNLPGQDIA